MWIGLVVMEVQGGLVVGPAYNTTKLPGSWVVGASKVTSDLILHKQLYKQS